VALEAVTSAGLEPGAWVTPVLALEALFEQTGTAPADIDIVDLNEPPSAWSRRRPPREALTLMAPAGPRAGRYPRCGASGGLHPATSGLMGGCQAVGS
jgi:hypothetical protein